MTGRVAGSLAAVVLLAACFPVVRQVDPTDEGLSLAFEVTNRSADEAEIGYEFQAGATGGGGNGSAGACRRSVILFGPVSGTVQILVDRAVIAESDLPAANLRVGYTVVPLEIASDGSATVGPMRVAPTVQEPAQPAIPGCP